MHTQVTPVGRGRLGPQRREAPGAKRLLARSASGIAKRCLREEGTRVRDTGRRGQTGTGAGCGCIPRSMLWPEAKLECARRREANVPE